MYGDYDLSISLRDFESWSNWHFISVSVHVIDDGKCRANLKVARLVVFVSTAVLYRYVLYKKKGERKQ